MAETAFLLKAACAFLVAAAWVMAAAKTAQRSSTWGGVVAALPSVTAFSLLFIAWTQDGGEAGKAAVPLPAGLGAAAVATTAYVRLAAKGRVTAALAGSAAAWFLAMLPLLLVEACRRPLAANGVGLLMLLGSTLLLPAPPQAAAGPAGWARGLPLKASLSGATVAAAVVVAGLLGPLAGAVVASFPIILWTNLMVFHAALGAAALGRMARGFMVGLLGGMVFANAGAALFPAAGILAAFAASYAACLATVAVIVLLGGHRDRRHA
ncbi:MAG: hypothetical protein HY924_01710 [Elusimicrobia bacterium]|nr:hypothetical protein [Elusimicrobiota bacterium]